MHVYMGSFVPGSTVYAMFNTQDLAGAPITMAGSPAILFYKNGGTTQSAGTGITLSVDFDGVVGLHNITTDTSQNSSFFADASECFAYISAGTVDGVSVVGKVVTQFTVATAANVGANLNAILGTSLTETSGQIAAAFKKFFDKATPTGTINSLPDAVAGATGGLFIAGTNAATSITTALTANITGNLSGSVGSVTGAVGSVTGAVGSVTGAVGSVTGNVGGNVVGTVASVVGAVGSVTGNVGGNVVGSVGSLTTNNDKTGYTLSNTGMDNLLTRAITEAYPSLGATHSLASFSYEMRAFLTNASIVTTTLTAKKIDNSTAATYTLNSATTPTAIVRAS